MKLIGKTKQLNKLWKVLSDLEEGKISTAQAWEKVKQWLKANCEWKK